MATSEQSFNSMQVQVGMNSSIVGKPLDSWSHQKPEKTLDEISHDLCSANADFSFGPVSISISKLLGSLPFGL
ncbi:hypothetical protein ABKV19_024733 [Rosa sericea]